MTLASEATAATDGALIAMCTAAAVESAISIYTEATTLAANLQSGVAVTSIPVSPVLGAAIAAATVVSVGNGSSGGEDAVSTLSALGAGAIGCAAFTPTRNHSIGEVISPPTVAGHAARAALATRVLASPSTYGALFAWIVASQGHDKSSLDSVIRADVSTGWNALAGA